VGFVPNLDDVVAAAMIDRLVHHCEVIAINGPSYRLKDRDLGRVPAAATKEPMTATGVSFHLSPGVSFRPSLTWSGAGCGCGSWRWRGSGRCPGRIATVGSGLETVGLGQDPLVRVGARFLTREDGGC
jgi:hypothetical protein